MKRCLAMLMALVMALSLVTPVMANEPSTNATISYGIYLGDDQTPTETYTTADEAVTKALTLMVNDRVTVAEMVDGTPIRGAFEVGVNDPQGGIPPFRLFCQDEATARSVYDRLLQTQKPGTAGNYQADVDVYLNGPQNGGSGDENELAYSGRTDGENPEFKTTDTLAELLTWAKNKTDQRLILWKKDCQNSSIAVRSCRTASNPSAGFDVEYRTDSFAEACAVAQDVAGLFYGHTYIEVIDTTGYVPGSATQFLLMEAKETDGQAMSMQRVFTSLDAAITAIDVDGIENDYVIMIQQVNTFNMDASDKEILEYVKDENSPNVMFFFDKSDKDVDTFKSQAEAWKDAAGYSVPQGGPSPGVSFNDIPADTVAYRIRVTAPSEVSSYRIVVGDPEQLPGVSGENTVFVADEAKLTEHLLDKVIEIDGKEANQGTHAYEIHVVQETAIPSGAAEYSLNAGKIFEKNDPYFELYVRTYSETQAENIARFIYDDSVMNDIFATVEYVQVSPDAGPAPYMITGVLIKENVITYKHQMMCYPPDNDNDAFLQELIAKAAAMEGYDLVDLSEYYMPDNSGGHLYNGIIDYSYENADVTVPGTDIHIEGDKPNTALQNAIDRARQQDKSRVDVRLVITSKNSTGDDTIRVPADATVMMTTDVWTIDMRRGVYFGDFSQVVVENGGKLMVGPGLYKTDPTQYLEPGCVVAKQQDTNLWLVTRQSLINQGVTISSNALQEKETYKLGKNERPGHVYLHTNKIAANIWDITPMLEKINVVLNASGNTADVKQQASKTEAIDLTHTSTNIRIPITNSNWWVVGKVLIVKHSKNDTEIEKLHAEVKIDANGNYYADFDTTMGFSTFELEEHTHSFNSDNVCECGTIKTTTTVGGNSVDMQVEPAVTTPEVSDSISNSEQKAVAEALADEGSRVEIPGAVVQQQEIADAIESLAQEKADNKTIEEITVTPQTTNTVKDVVINSSGKTTSVTFDVDAVLKLVIRLVGESIPKLADVELSNITGPVPMELPAPAGWADGTTVYVTHTKGNGMKYYHTTTVAGGAVAFTNRHGFSDFTLSLDDPTPKFSSSGSSYTPSGHLVTSTLNGIEKVYVDGVLVDSKNYTVSGGDIVLSQRFLDSLKAGAHSVKLVYGNRQAIGTFSVKGSTLVQSAKTFDAGIALYAGMAMSSALGAAYVLRKKKEN